jgi:hypothetical protein
VQDAGVKIDLVPPQRDQLARSQAVPVGDQDHRGVPVSVPIAPGGRDQLLDLGFGQVFAGAIVGIGASLRANCLFYGCWGD